jgi:hypothetical protein
MKRLSCLHEAVKATRQLCLLVTSMNGTAEIVVDEMALRTTSAAAHRRLSLVVKWRLMASWSNGS